MHLIPSKNCLTRWGCLKRWSLLISNHNDEGIFTAFSVGHLAWYQNIWSSVASVALEFCLLTRCVGLVIVYSLLASPGWLNILIHSLFWPSVRFLGAAKLNDVSFVQSSMIRHSRLSPHWLWGYIVFWRISWVLLLFCQLLWHYLSWRKSASFSFVILDVTPYFKNPVWRLIR